MKIEYKYGVGTDLNPVNNTIHLYIKIILNIKKEIMLFDLTKTNNINTLIMCNSVFSLQYLLSKENSLNKTYYRNQGSLTIYYDLYIINLTTVFMKTKIYYILQSIYHKIISKYYYMNYNNECNIYHLKNINVARYCKNTLYI
jgi:hypothetical protein